MSRVSVMGSGSWGTAFAMVLADAGNDVVIWSRERAVADDINLRHRNESYHPGIDLPGGMASTTSPQACLAGAGVVVLANDNNIGNVVISGSKPGIDAALAYAKEKGARAILLNVSAPFHSPLMQPAAEAMAEALAKAEIAPLAVPLVANVTARPVNEPATVRKLLVEQVTGRVRWRESNEWMAGEGGVTRFVEVGAGKQLTGMVKRNAPNAEALALNEPADLEAFAKTV